MPPILPLPAIQVSPGGRAGDGAVRLNAPELVINASNLREYTPGDSMRWIHWPTTARKDEIFVRVFDGAPLGDWWIFLDLDQRVQLGDGPNATDEHGITLAASLTDLGMRTGRSVGLIMHGRDGLIWHRPRMSEDAKWTVLRSLALVEPGDSPLSVLLATSRSQLSSNTSLILITPAIQGSWLEDLLRLRKLGTVPTVFLLDPVSFGAALPQQDVRPQLTTLGISYKTISRDLLDFRNTTVINPGYSP
jgi:uncharacterized protein (DUF58 family)